MGSVRSRFVRGWTSALLIVVALAAPVLPVAARPGIESATLTVNSVADPGAGGCDGGECTLREAIQVANADADRDTIEFAIPGAGPHTIRPTSALPTLAQPVVIDGYTQSAAQVNTQASGTNAKLQIVLDGSEAGATASGLVIAGGNTTIRGLVINNFAIEGIELRSTASNSNNLIEGNFIGTNPNGTAAAGNGRGVLADGSRRNQIGGHAPAARNLIAGNQFEGVQTDSDDNAILGNLIGTDKTGTKNLGNGREGVSIDGSDNLVAGNVIAFNHPDGVGVYSGTGNQIRSNRIFSHEGLGIDANSDGPTPNDADDPDTGPNNLQNFPVISTVTSTKTKTTVAGSLNSLPNTTFRIEFFANPSVDGAEGKTFLGRKDVTTDGGGDAAFTFTTRKRVRAGQAVTATATNLDTGDTSEFSAAQRVRRG